MQGDPIYEPVNQLWQKLQPLPPCSREEATKAVATLCRKFGRKDGGHWQRRDFKVKKIRRCWVDLQAKASEPAYALVKGWARIVHDLSHMIYEERVGPSGRGHCPSHARLELELAQFVGASGWLQGTLKPKAAPRASTEEKRAKRMAQTLAGIARWKAKAKRAENALKKLNARREYLNRVMTANM